MIDNGSKPSSGLTTIKTEGALLEPSHPISHPEDQGNYNVNSNGKRRRTSTVQYVNLDIDLDLESDYEPETQRVKIEKSSKELENHSTKPKARTRTPLIGRYQETCRYFQKQFAKLPDSRRLSVTAFHELYKRAHDLIVFIKVEYDERQEELVKLRDTRTQLNAKMKALRTALVDSKESCKAAEIRASLHEKNYKDANLQLTLKLAQPLSHAQTKLKTVHQDYATEMAELRTELVAEKRAKESALTDLAEVRATTAQTSAKPNAQIPWTTQQIQTLHQELAKMRKLHEGAMASVHELATTNAEPKTRAKDLQGENDHLKEVVDTMATAQTQVTVKKETLEEDLNSLKAKIQEQNELLIEQAEAVAFYESSRRHFRKSGS